MGTGALAKRAAGGENVTGYDFISLLCGSLGSLAVITKLNFRKYPNPPSRRGFLASFSEDSGALGLFTKLPASPLNPALLEVLSPEFAKLFLEEHPLSVVATGYPGLDRVRRLSEGSAEVCDATRGFVGTGANRLRAKTRLPFTMRSFWRCSIFLAKRRQP